MTTSKRLARKSLCGGQKSLSCPFRTIFWDVNLDDITKIYLLFFFLPSQKKNELLWNFFNKIMQPFQSLKL